MLVALGGCLTAGIAAVAQQRQIQLRSVQASVAAEMDLHGILGADPDVRNGFSGVTVSYRIDADATAEEIEALVAQSQKRSAVYDILTNPTERHRRGLLTAVSGRDRHAGHDDRGHRGRALRAGDEPLPGRAWRSTTSSSNAARWRTRGAPSGGTRCACSPRTG